MRYIYSHDDIGLKESLVNLFKLLDVLVFRTGHIKEYKDMPISLDH